jgi:hypothetical protein
MCRYKSKKNYQCVKIVTINEVECQMKNDRIVKGLFVF